MALNYVETGSAEFDESYPSQSDLDADPELNKSTARITLEIFGHARTHLLETSVALSKWILTSLLATNAGAAVAVTHLNMRPGLQLAAGACFVVGLIVPLVIALISIKNGERLAGKLGVAIGYWHSVEHHGGRTRETEIELFQLRIDANEAKKWPNRLGIASTGLFISGCALAGLGILCALPPYP